MYTKLGIRPAEGNSERDQLTQLITQLKNGGTGNRRDGSWEPMDCGAVDLFDHNTSNPFNVYCLIYGREGFNASSLRGSSEVVVDVRYFMVGSTPSKRLTPKQQQAIAKNAMGDDKALDDTTKERRQKNWESWYHGDDAEAAASYVQNDLPTIAYVFREFWNNTTNDALDEETKLKAIAVELRELLDLSNCLTRRPSKRPRFDNNISTTASAETPAREADDSAFQITPESTELDQQEGSDSTSVDGAQNSISAQSPQRSDEGELDKTPDQLLTENLNRLITSNEEKDLEEFARIEFALNLIYKQSLSMDDARNAIAAKDIGEPASIGISLIYRMNQRQYKVAWNNIQVQRKKLVEKMPAGLFRPKDSDMLFDWILNGRRYSAGQRVQEATKAKPNFEWDQKANKWILTDRASHYLRHIHSAFNIAPSRIPSLWNCFAVLTLGRPLEEDEFVSIRTLRTRFQRLDLIDWQQFNEEFTKWITTPDEYGFRRLWYMVSDDSRHFDMDRHVCLMTAHRPRKDKSDATPNPCFRLLTAAAAVSKGSAGNSALNIEAAQERLSEEAIKHFGGGTTDNAADALLETRSTFDGIMDRCEVEDTFLYGVARRPLQLGDPFHKDNLVCEKATTAAFGLTERDNHSEIGHPQLLQSFHDVHSKDRIESQNAMDTVMEGTDKKVAIRTTRERKQRWLVNQAFAKYILGLFDIETNAKEVCIIAWARYMSEHTDGWRRRAAGEILVMLLKPEIILALYFEADLGVYFEATMRWHSSPGHLCDRSGFRILEHHELHFGFTVPFWNEAVSDFSPSNKRFGKTFKYLENHRHKFKDYELQRQKIIAGLKAGYAQVCKNSKDLLTPPLIFLRIRDSCQGPPLLRAILALLDEQDEYDELPEALRDEAWGQFRYSSNEDQRSAVEKAFYKLLRDDDADLAHWIQQLGLWRDVTRADLQKLSREEPGERHDNTITAFASQYPVIFAAFLAALGLFPSGSRMGEQAHGGLRYALRKHVSLASTDMSRGYVTNIDYHAREERRNDVREREKERLGGQTKQRKGSIKHDETKAEQRKMGVQLLESGERYEPEVISSMPADFLKTIEIRHLKEKGYNHKNKELADKKAELAREKDSRRTGESLSIDEWREKAKEIDVRNDANFRDGATQQRDQDILRLLTKTFWSKLPKKRDGNNSYFYETAKAVLPHVKLDDPTATKKAMLGKIGPHLKLVEKVADKKIQNPFSGADISELDHRLDILYVFVKPEKTTVLEEERSESTDRIQKASELMNAFAETEIDKNFFSLLPTCTEAEDGFDCSDDEDEYSVD